MLRLHLNLHMSQARPLTVGQRGDVLSLHSQLGQHAQPQSTVGGLIVHEHLELHTGSAVTVEVVVCSPWAHVTAFDAVGTTLAKLTTRNADQSASTEEAGGLMGSTGAWDRSDATGHGSVCVLPAVHTVHG